MRDAALRTPRPGMPGGRDTVDEHPRHPCTQALLAAVPVPDPPAERARRAAARA